ncbi:sulfotransferase 1C4-like isoform X2 [Narcine bancroftii]
MQEIVDLILMDGDADKSKRAPVYLRIPFLEMFAHGDIPSGVETIMKMESPRIIKTHLPFQLMPKSFWELNCKAIVVARNPKDVAVSYFHFHRMNQAMPEPGPWDQFLQTFVNGQVSWGCSYEHALGWWEARKLHQILFIFYEDIKEDPRREILKVASFLGKVLDEIAVEKVVHHSQFAVMKDNPMANYSTLPSTIFNQAISKFMRKGEVGDWKNLFTVAQNEAFDEFNTRKLSGTDLRFREVL